MKADYFCLGLLAAKAEKTSCAGVSTRPPHLFHADVYDALHCYHSNMKLEVDHTAAGEKILMQQQHTLHFYEKSVFNCIHLT